MLDRETSQKFHWSFAVGYPFGQKATHERSLLLIDAMPGFEDQLFGASKLNLIPASEDRADAEEHYHAEKNDLEFLLDKLTEISRRYNVDWAIQIEGEPVGPIDNGVCDPAVRDAVEAMADLSNELGEYGDLGDFV